MVSPINYMLDTVPFTMCCYRYLDDDEGDCDASILCNNLDDHDDDEKYHFDDGLNANNDDNDISQPRLAPNGSRLLL